MGFAAGIAAKAGGRLLLHGGNDIGIRSSAKQLAKLLQVEPVTLSSRAHSRVLLFDKTEQAALVPDLPGEVIISPRPCI